MSIEAVQTVAIATRAAPRRRFNGQLTVTLVALGWVALVLVVAVVPALFAAGDPTALQPQRALAAPGETPLGTDQFGRSLWLLIVHGARQSVIVGLAATALAVALGCVLGLWGGYAGGLADMIIGRVIDTLMCFPGVLLALIIAAALGPSIPNLIIAVGVAAVPQFSRVMRGQVLSVRGRLFVEAARSLGFRQLRIILRHVLPNSLAPIVVLATISVGVAIVSAASLSFLGLGPRTDVPDWGQLLASGQPYLSSAWWISTFPGIAITLTVLSISLLGDWLRDRLDTD
ncbi:ABC transporter permease [Leucobacter albus]|uniref:ABC transporter permease n=1 Tax=Leucobacter albus TaxID=272210 RepID=A0ABW3TRU6_9MICO